MRVLVVLLASLAVATFAQTTDCSDLSFCSTHGQCIDAKCVCHAGWGFDDCSLSTTNCVNHCFGHGDCLNGTCTCESGYGGSDCSVITPTCPNNCTGHGTCHNGECNCFPGLWTGEACDIEIYRCPNELNNCFGRGQCGPIDWENETSAWSCRCDAGFCGDACNLVCGNCPKNCSGHGYCKGGVCECHVGFGGSDCSSVAPIASCPNNCTGRGRCLQTNGTNSFRCVCDECYIGADCSKSPVFCPGNCSGRGVCDCQGMCHCRAGFEGIACQSAIPVCEDLNYCSGNGQCNNGTCKCNPGFAGKACDLACHTGGGNATVGCNAPVHGACFEYNGTAQCVCKPEYQGVGCELSTSQGMLDDYVNGFNPIGTVVLALVVCAVAGFVGGLTINFVQGKRGLNAVPGFSNVRSKIRADDYEAMQGSTSQRTASNY